MNLEDKSHKQVGIQYVLVRQITSADTLVGAGKIKPAIGALDSALKIGL